MNEQEEKLEQNKKVLEFVGEQIEEVCKEAITGKANNGFEKKISYDVSICQNRF